MIPTSDLEKWQKAIQNIEAEQKNLSPEEWSAFNALKGFLNSGNFESNESGALIKILKDALPSHSNHRLLQKVHLPYFIRMCETYFATSTFESPPFQSYENQDRKYPNQIVENPVINLTLSNTGTIVPTPQKKGSNKQLILIIAAIALIIAGWQIYKNWDTVRNWEPVSKLLGKTTEQGIPVDSMLITKQMEDSVKTVVAQQAGDTAILTSTTQESEKSVSSNSPKANIQPVTQTSKIITKTYSFGTYKGNAINGYPEGNGKMAYSRQVQIAKHDTKSPPHFAEAGDYFVGSWGNGDIISGTLYDRNGNVKEKIVAPKRFNLHDISND